MGDIVDEDKRGIICLAEDGITEIGHHKYFASSPMHRTLIPEIFASICKRVITLYGILMKVHKDGSNQVQMVKFEVRRCHLFAQQWKRMFRRETKDHEIESARDNKSAIPLQI
jgi:hypothetical protein